MVLREAVESPETGQEGCEGLAEEAGPWIVGAMNLGCSMTSLEDSKRAGW